MPTIQKGLEFRNIHMPNHRFIVREVNEESNVAKVKIIPPAFTSSTSWEEDWNLEHTKVGFERNEYHCLINIE